MASARKSGTTETPYRVLVAEDDPASRRLLTAALESANFAVTTVNDGRELYDVLTSAPVGYFRLVVTDQSMPQMFGVEVLARAGARAPFVIVTGVHTPAVQMAAERFGAAAYFTKPLDIAELLEAAERIAVERTVPGRILNGGE